MLDGGSLGFWDGNPIEDERLEEYRFEKAIQYWKKMPVSITRIFGPMIRKHIGL